MIKTIYRSSIGYSELVNSGLGLLTGVQLSNGLWKEAVAELGTTCWRPAAQSMMRVSWIHDDPLSPGHTAFFSSVLDGGKRSSDDFSVLTTLWRAFRSETLQPADQMEMQ